MAPPMKWKPEQIEMLRVLAQQGWSASHIGDKIGVSRNSVIGMARRQGIPLGVTHKDKTLPRARNGRWVRPKLPAVWVPAAPSPAPARTAAPPEPCLLIDLTPKSCRWVMNDKWPHMFCGSPEADLNGGAPYCSRHMRIAYPRSERRPRENSPAYTIQRTTLR